MKIYKNMLTIMLIFTVGSLMVACKEEKTVVSKKTEGYKLYYVNANKENIVYDNIVFKSKESDRLINEIIMKLKAGNYKKSKEAVIPSYIESCMYNISANILSLNFDSNYDKLEGRDEVLRRAAIVMTFCQLDGIEYVRITSGGKLIQVKGQEVGNMSTRTFIDMVGEDSDYMINEDVSLYFADSSGKKLRKLSSKVKSDGTVMLEELVVRKLIDGPSGIDKLGYYRTVNGETRINRVAVKNNICYIDFSKEFLEKTVGVSEDVVIYSVVNSLTELSTVNQVRITVNGEEKDIYNDYGKMYGNMERNYDIINEAK